MFVLLSQKEVSESFWLMKNKLKLQTAKQSVTHYGRTGNLPSCLSLLRQWECPLLSFLHHEEEFTSIQLRPHSLFSPPLPPWAPCFPFRFVCWSKIYLLTLSLHSDSARLLFFFFYYFLNFFFLATHSKNHKKRK